MSGQKRIRVLYSYPYLNFDTGSPKALAQMVEALDRSLFEPVYCAPGEGPLADAMAARSAEIVRGASGAITLRHPIGALSAIRRQAARLKTWRIDLLHTNGLFWNCDLTLGAWMARIPVIAHVHNPMEIAFQNLVRFAASRVLFCSEFEMRNCIHPERIAGKAEVFHNFIDTSRFTNGRSIRGKLEIRDDAFVIGTVAQIVERKGIDILIETARILLQDRPDVVFLIAGPVSDLEAEFGRRMLSLAASPEFRGAVRFVGSRTDIPDFLASLDLFLLPSRAEPMGIVILEAMAAGLPVVASRVGGIPEIITEAEIGRLVDPIAPAAFAEAVRGVLAQADRGRTMGLCGRASVIDRFDVVSGRERLTRIYLDVLRSRKSMDYSPSPQAARLEGLRFSGNLERPDSSQATRIRLR